MEEGAVGQFSERCRSADGCRAKGERQEAIRGGLLASAALLIEHTALCSLHLSGHQVLHTGENQSADCPCQRRTSQKIFLLTSRVSLLPLKEKEKEKGPLF